MIKECWCTARKVRTPTFFVSLRHVMVVAVRGIMLRLTAIIIVVIFCFSTTRHGGCSEGNYASFNCNHYCGDAPDKVGRNRELLCSLLPVRPRMLVVPHQTHDTVVKVVDEAFLRLSSEEQLKQLEGVDAMVSDALL